jgi:polysaccharide transporter, PST family
VSSFIKWLPLVWKKRIEGRPNLKKAAVNTIWLFGDKIIRMGIGLVVGVWVARYLGPEQFGLFNYAIAFVALFASFSALGLQGIIVRDLVRDWQVAPRLIGTALLLQLAGGCVALVVCIGTISFLRPNDATAIIVVAVTGIGLVFKAADPIRYWFEAKVLSRYVVMMENGVFLVMVLGRVSLIGLKAPLIAFVWLAIFESAIVAFGLLFIYRKRVGGLRSLTPSVTQAKVLLRESWPLILSGLAIMLYMRIDQIMIGSIMGNHFVGVYSAAIRISEIWYFIPLAIVSSVFPSIVEAKKNNMEAYQLRLKRLYFYLFLLSLAAALVITIFSEPIVFLLYGAPYADAAKVLSLHVWAGIFVAVGVANSQWLLLEGLLPQATINTVVGAFINIILNYCLIPIWGVKGAAVSTLLAYAFSAYLMLYLRASTRPSFYLISNAFLFNFKK